MKAPHYQDSTVTLHHGDCLDVLRTLPDASVDSVVTDPPYGLGFMGKEWDSGKSFVERKPAKRNTFDHVGGNHNPTSSADAARTRRSESRKFGEWCELWAAECLRVLKPGGHLLAFGGTRTWHRLACAVEDAGFEVRDSIAWLYGSGFPKSLDVSKAIDKAEQQRHRLDAIVARARGDFEAERRALDAMALAEREVISTERSPFRMADKFMGDAYQSTQSGDTRETDAEGYIVRKITAPATPDAERWQGWGTALKPAFEPVVVGRKPLVGTVAGNVLTHGTGALNIDATRIGSNDNLVQPAIARSDNDVLGKGLGAGVQENPAGRWPANVVLDETQAEALDEQSGTLTSGANPTRRGSDKFREAYGDFKGQEECTPARGVDIGGASRFFYVAKADASERPRVNGTAHPTVKPLALMRWLVRLVTPPGGVVLEPFAGSGTTVEACIIEGFRCIAIEKGAEYLPLIEARIARRRDPVRAIELNGEDLGLFGEVGA